MNFLCCYFLLTLFTYVLDAPDTVFWCESDFLTDDDLLPTESLVGSVKREGFPTVTE
jgi:hypothetical protein